MNTPKISIILTSYNKPRTVGKVIESILNQTFPYFELFIMDDNSSVETQNIILGYLTDPRLHYFQSNVSEEQRYTKTRYSVLINQAIPLTKGEYVSYVTDDAVYERDRLEIMSRYLDEHSNVQAVYGAQRITEFNSEFEPLHSWVRETNGIIPDGFCLVDHASVMHRRYLLEFVIKKYGNYWGEDPIWWGIGDAVFWRRLSEYCSLYPIDRVLEHHLHHTSHIK